MFKHAYRQFLVVAVGLSITGLAAAHNPPSLVQRQAASEHATQGSAGYRDMHARFGDVAVLAPRVMKSAGGYRDIAHRFPNARPRVLIANAK
jgi:hypothetical protein